MKYSNLETGKFYHIYNRGNNKENLFKEDRNYFYFLKLLAKHIVPVAEIYSYCLLPNHFHLLVRIKDMGNLGPAIEDRKIWQPFSNLFNAYTKSINKEYDRTGSLFQYKFKRKEIASEEYLGSVIIYIHLNPVNHGIDSEFENYPYSSYMALTSNLPSNIMRGEVLQYFEDKENFIYCHRKGYEEKIIEVLDLEN